MPAPSESDATTASQPPSSASPRRVLITGGNGNIGRLIAEELLALGMQVLKFDIPGTEPENTQDGETVVIGDIRDQTTVRKLFIDFKPDTVIHLASLLSGSSAANPSAAWDINANASFHLLTLAVEFNANRFFFASSIATYGDQVPDPMPEDTPQWPTNLYGATKVAVERAGVFFKAEHGLDFRCLRFPLVFSPFAPPAAVTAFPSHAFRAAANPSYSDTFRIPVNPNVGMSSMLLNDVITGTVKFVLADAAKLTQPAYSLHGYFVSAQDVIDEIQSRVPNFKMEFVVDEFVNELLSAWPNIIVDDTARRDWGWAPQYDFKASADWLMDYFQAQHS